MELETADLIIRDYFDSDLEAVHRYATDSDVLRYILWGPNTLEETKAFIMNSIGESLENPRTAFNLAVIEKPTSRLIGGVSLSISGDSGEIGWILQKASWHQGYGTQAAQALLNYALTVLHLKQIVATCDAKNVASFNVMKKIGMIQIGFQTAVRQSRDQHQPKRDQILCRIELADHHKI